MRVALTGATGFIGRYIAHHLAEAGCELRCWRRAGGDDGGFDGIRDLQWLDGELGDLASAKALVAGCDAVVHAALFRTGVGFRGAEGDVVEFAQKNVLGSLQLIEAARKEEVDRFIFVSTCAVHEQILDDRPLDETHPLRPTSHYGAHKGAIEQFVHSYGLGQGYPICALRPTGVYGVARPVERSKWYDLVAAVVRGDPVACTRGGKEVHAGDVARAVGVLLNAEGIAGQAFNCYDCYVSELEVAGLAKELSGGRGEIAGEPRRPKHQIVVDKLRNLGMTFGGDDLLRRTVAELVDAAKKEG